MNKFYVNNYPIFLMSLREAQPLKQIANATSPLFEYEYGLDRMIAGYIEGFEASPRTMRSAILTCRKLEELQEAVMRMFDGTVEAAGGLVLNPSGKILAIYRRGFWDLPKGKIDDGESKEEAALREVREETGLKNLELGEFLLTTHHCYRTREGERILKATHWYKMTTTDYELIPQESEDIEKAVWLNKENFLGKVPIYGSVLDVLAKI